MGKAELADRLEPKAEAVRQKYYAEIARLERNSRRFRNRYSRMSVNRHYTVRREDIVAAAQLARQELLRKKRAKKYISRSQVAPQRGGAMCCKSVSEG